MYLRFFDKAINTDDKEVLALNDSLLKGLNKKAIQKRYNMRGQQASKVLGAKALILRVQKDAMLTPQTIRTGDNQVIDKIIHDFINEIDDPKGIIISYNPITNKYEVIRLDEVPQDAPKKVETTEDSKPSEPETKVKTKKSTSVVTPDMIIEAFTQRRATGLSIAKIANSLGVSSTTIHRILNEEYISKYPEAYEKAKNPPAEDEVSTEEVETTNQTEDESSFIETDIIPIAVSKDESIFKCGLINERHVLPVETYVYDNCFDQKTLFDFDGMDRKAEKFIKDNIPFKDGIAQKSIHLYITGLQSAMCAFIKMCQRMKVNLALMHYDMMSRTFQRQIVWDEFDNGTVLGSEYEMVDKLLFQADKAFIYKCNSLSGLTSNDTLYCLTASVFDPNEQLLKLKYCEVYLCDSLEAATEAFNKATLKSLAYDGKMGVYLDKCLKGTYKFYKDRRVLKTQNF